MVVVGGLFGGFKEESRRPAFQEYAFQAMFQQASNLIVNWNLDLPRPVTTNMVTRFSAGASVDGPSGMMVFSNRFSFGWDAGKFAIFRDLPYVSDRTLSYDVDANDALLEQWMRATNLLTVEKARQIAESVFRSVAKPADLRKFKKPDKAKQMIYEWKDGKKYPLPYYIFKWGIDKDLANIGSPADYRVEVSGITSNVVCCSLLTPPGTETLRPTNYFELLGLPPNPIFVYRLPGPTNRPPIYKLYEPTR